MPKLYFLGTGTSTGVPQMGCSCPVCTSSDPRDRRLRTSAMLETDEGRRILIDCGPDFRQQMLSIPFRPMEAVLLTHEHYVHLGGLDDVRPFTVFGAAVIYADPYCARHLRERIPYCFVEKKYPGVPSLVLHDLTLGHPFEVAGCEVLPFEVMHGKLPIVGYRIGELAYITDMSVMNESSKALLKGLKVLVVNALRFEPHATHQSLKEALTLIEELQPERSFLTHFSHGIGLHAETSLRLPPTVELAYDGRVVAW